MIAGPEAGATACLDELRPDLVIGWATWCRPCTRQLPKVVELVRGTSLRVVTVSFGDDGEAAIAHLRELGVDDWTILQLDSTTQKQSREGSLALEPIPFMLLVDERGQISAGPPWLDADALAAALRATPRPAAARASLRSAPG